MKTKNPAAKRKNKNLTAPKTNTKQQKQMADSVKVMVKQQPPPKESQIHKFKQKKIIYAL